MAAYILIDQLSVTDQSAFVAYEPLASAAVKGYGGQYVLPHQASIEALEGNWRPHHIVVIEFVDAEQARQWWTLIRVCRCAGDPSSGSHRQHHPRRRHRMLTSTLSRGGNADVTTMLPPT